MFDSLQEVKAYEKTLKILSDPKYDKMDICLHDYDKGKLRFSGFHFGGLNGYYPGSLVHFLTGQVVGQCDSAFHRAYFPGVQKWMNGRDDYYPENSRFEKVPYKKVRDIIEGGIRELLEKARKEAEAEIPALKSYTEHVKTLYGKFLPASLRIDLDPKGNITVAALKPKAFVRHGFGSFLEKPKGKAPISISKAALGVLQKLPARDGLMGFEIFEGPIVCWGSTSPLLVIPPQACSVQEGAFEQFKKKIVVQD